MCSVENPGLVFKIATLTFQLNSNHTNISIVFTLNGLLAKPSLLVLTRKSRTTRRRGHIRVAISTAPDLSGSGGVDMPTRPVACSCNGSVGLN